MATSTPPLGRFICRLCRAELRRTKRPATSFNFRPSRSLITPAQSPRLSLPSKKGSAQSERARPIPKPLSRAPQLEQLPLPQRQFETPAEAVTTPTFSLSSIVTDTARILSSQDKIPAETDVLEVLAKSLEYANYVVFGQTMVPDEIEEAGEKPSDNTATSSLLDLEEISTHTKLNAATPNRSSTVLSTSPERAAKAISKVTYELLCAPAIYITPTMLEIYVRIHCLLDSPQYLPQIFHLYANKPIPKPNSSPIVYKKPWPRHPKNAIPQPLSDAALSSACARRDLPLALSIIETTVALPAFRIAKLLRRASIPFAALAAFPVALYIIADHIAENVQVAWDPEMSRFITLSACAGYFGTLGTVGFVALMTYNDHHERVVWQPGNNLRSRWMREEERLYYDRVAMAWGFKERWKRGEEHGEEWEALREWIGIRGMVLDKSNLLEGME